MIGYSRVVSKNGGEIEEWIADLRILPIDEAQFTTVNNIAGVQIAMHDARHAPRMTRLSKPLEGMSVPTHQPSALEDDDDVQAVFANFEVDEATLARLTDA